MVSLKLSNVYDDVFRSELALETSARNHEARERLASVLDELRRNKGWSTVMRGHDFRLRAVPRDIVKERREVRLKITLKVAPPRPALSKVTTYVPLRCRSYYTFLDSTLSPTALVNLAKQNGMTSVAMTDLGNLHGAAELARVRQAGGHKKPTSEPSCM